MTDERVPEQRRAGDRPERAGPPEQTDPRVARVVPADGLERELRRMVVLHRRTLAGRVAGTRRAGRARA